MINEKRIYFPSSILVHYLRGRISCLLERLNNTFHKEWQMTLFFKVLSQYLEAIFPIKFFSLKMNELYNIIDKIWIKHLTIKKWTVLLDKIRCKLVFWSIRQTYWLCSTIYHSLIFYLLSIFLFFFTVFFKCDRKDYILLVWFQSEAKNLLLWLKHDIYHAN